MFNTYTYTEYPYLQSREQAEGQTPCHEVVVVGAGPIGLTAALEGARRGLHVVVLDDNNTVSVGSRAVCYAKRTLEIWDRLGVAKGLIDQGVSWQVGKVFQQDELVYQFDLLPEPHHKNPAMINLQQYYIEEALVQACRAEPLIDLRWKHKVVGLQQSADHAFLQVETPDGRFDMKATWVLACDGANSDMRNFVGAAFEGQAFQDRFLIADVVMKADFPTERWFWFDPPFHRNQSVLLHKQAKNVWRIDFQLGWDADPVEEKKPENVIPRIQAMLGKDTEFELEWVSVYQFACRRIEHLRHGRVFFAGDSAHQVSPFGARGANTGVQDIDNLMWKLAFVQQGLAGDALVNSYHDERSYAADDNLLNSTRSTDFITPKSKSSKMFRDASLELARSHAFARPMVNSGRLSTPTPYRASPLITQDPTVPSHPPFTSNMAPGAACADAPVRAPGKSYPKDVDASSWLLDQLPASFSLLIFDALAPDQVPGLTPDVQVLAVGRDLVDSQGLVAARYDARPGTVYLIRPDHHVAARWRSLDMTKVQVALNHSLALG
jgi:3-(3-hydroxy-phenyl)propionate hydroxylase